MRSIITKFITQLSLDPYKGVNDLIIKQILFFWHLSVKASMKQNIYGESFWKAWHKIKQKSFQINLCGFTEKE